MNNPDHANTMSQMHSGRQSLPKTGIAEERTRRSSIPVSRSFAASSSYSRISSRSVSTTSSTRSSSPIDAPQSSAPEIQPVQHASDPLSDHSLSVTVRSRGEWKTITFPVKKRPSAVPSEPVVAKEEEARTDKAQIESETEIENLKMKVERLSYGNAGLVDKVEEKEMQRQDTETKLREVAGANRALQVGITQRISEFANLSPENALWKQMSEKWQGQEIPDDDSVLKKDYIECHKGVNTMVIEDYVLMHVEIDQQNTQFQHEIQILRDQVAREQEAREQAEEQARELARELAAQQERITQLELQNQRSTERFTLEQEALNQAEEQSRRQAAQLQAARVQVAEVQGQNDTLTQENNTLRTRVEELENQQNELQQRNNTLEAQRRDDVDLILAILDAQQLRETFLTYHYNELLRQHDITRNDNEQLVQALVDTVTQYEDELAVVLCQMAEMHGASWSEADVWGIIKTLDENSRNARNRPSRSRGSPHLRLTRRGGRRQLEYMTPDGQWRQLLVSSPILRLGL